MKFHHLIILIIAIIYISSKKLSSRKEKDSLIDTVSNVTSYVVDKVLSDLSKELHNEVKEKKEKRKYNKTNLLNKVIKHDSIKNNTNYRNEPNHVIDVSVLEKDINNLISDKNETLMNEVYNESETLKEVYDSINWTVLFENMKELAKEEEEQEEQEQEEIIIQQKSQESQNKEDEKIEEPENSIIQDEEIIDNSPFDNNKILEIIQPPKQENNLFNNEENKEEELDIVGFNINKNSQRDDNYNEEPEQNLNDGIPQQEESRDYSIQESNVQEPEDNIQEPINEEEKKNEDKYNQYVINDMEDSINEIIEKINKGEDITKKEQEKKEEYPQEPKQELQVQQQNKEEYPQEPIQEQQVEQQNKEEYPQEPVQEQQVQQQNKEEYPQEPKQEQQVEQQNKEEYPQEPIQEEEVFEIINPPQTKEEENVEQQKEELSQQLKKENCSCHNITEIKETIESLLNDMVILRDAMEADNVNLKDAVQDYVINKEEKKITDSINLKLTGNYSTKTDELSEGLRKILKKLESECTLKEDAENVKSFIQKKYGKIINQFL